jgi:hypothetical protein
MFNGIDHVVVVIANLESAIESYTRAGFTVVRGGKHSIGTHNALIAFADGAYIELIAFQKPVPGHPWQTALESGGGLIDFCMRSDDLGADVEALKRAGAKIGALTAMTRDRPDGYRLSWELAIPEPPFNGQLPFLIKDETPRDERVPHERTHRNGVAGIASVTLALEDPATTSRYYECVLDSPGRPLERPDLNATGIIFTIGSSNVELLASKRENGPLANWIRTRGKGVYAVTLRSDHDRTLDPSLLQNARLTIAS